MQIHIIYYAIKTYICLKCTLNLMQAMPSMIHVSYRRPILYTRLISPSNSPYTSHIAVSFTIHLSYRHTVHHTPLISPYRSSYSSHIAVRSPFTSHIAVPFIIHLSYRRPFTIHLSYHHPVYHTRLISLSQADPPPPRATAVDKLGSS